MSVEQTEPAGSYNLIAWTKIDVVDGEFVYGERQILSEGARYEIAVMSGNYWVGKFPEDIVMLVEV